MSFSRLCYYLNEASVGMRRGTIYLANRKVSVTRSATRFGFDVVSNSNNVDSSRNFANLFSDGYRIVRDLSPN